MRDLPHITLRHVLIGFGSAGLTLAIVAYVVFQARFLLQGPVIVLDEPLPIATNERALTLTGSAANISRIWLNERQIFTDPNGRFRELLVLENGYTVATLRAEDRYGRSVQVSRPFVYIPGSLLYTVE
jgi:hypothetical protein